LLAAQVFQAELGQAKHGRHAWLAETEVSEQFYFLNCVKYYYMENVYKEFPVMGGGGAWN
jgi:hypothetical protein